MSAEAIITKAIEELQGDLEWGESEYNRLAIKELRKTQISLERKRNDPGPKDEFPPESITHSGHLWEDMVKAHFPRIRWTGCERLKICDGLWPIFREITPERRLELVEGFWGFWPDKLEQLTQAAADKGKKLKPYLPKPQHFLTWMHQKYPEEFAVAWALRPVWWDSMNRNKKRGPASPLARGAVSQVLNSKTAGPAVPTQNLPSSSPEETLAPRSINAK